MKTRSPVKTVLFYALILLIFGLAAAVMALIGARWYGWVLLCLILAGLVLLRRGELWRGWRRPLAVLLAAALLMLTAVISRPDMEVSFAGTLARESIRAALNLPSMRGNGMLSAGARYAARPSEWSPPKGYTNTKYDIGVPVELLEREDGRADKLILQFHGGAYVMGFMDIYRDLAVRYSRLALGASVLSVDYRIAPEHTYPAALEDALTAWDWLIGRGYKAENVMVAGEAPAAIWRWRWWKSCATRGASCPAR